LKNIRKIFLFFFFVIRVISTLEKIKTEASEIMQKVEETDIILNEVEKVSHEYLPMAKACSSIFFTLSSLSTVNENLQRNKNPNLSFSFQ
jgi:chaperonin cofactor prefoldin